MLPTRQGSLRLFRAAGIDVFVHWSWFVVAAIEFQYRGGTSTLRQIWNLLEYRRFVFHRSAARIRPCAGLPPSRWRSQSDRPLALGRGGLRGAAAPAWRDALDDFRRSPGKCRSSCKCFWVWASVRRRGRTTDQDLLIFLSLSVDDKSRLCSIFNLLARFSFGRDVKHPPVTALVRGGARSEPNDRLYRGIFWGGALIAVAAVVKAVGYGTASWPFSCSCAAEPLCGKHVSWLKLKKPPSCNIGKNVRLGGARCPQTRRAASPAEPARWGQRAPP